MFNLIYINKLKLDEKIRKELIANKDKKKETIFKEDIKKEP